MFDDAPSGRRQVGLHSAPPLVSVGCVVASAERKPDITLHHTGDNCCEDASFEICSICKLQKSRSLGYRHILTEFIGLGVFPSQLWSRAEVHCP
jgi:hypothetical protein